MSNYKLIINKSSLSAPFGKRLIIKNLEKLLSIQLFPVNLDYVVNFMNSYDIEPLINNDDLSINNFVDNLEVINYV